MAVAAVTVLALLVMCVNVANAQVDCTTPFNNLQPCIDYVNSNSSAPPSAQCCTAFGTTETQQPVCLCQLLQAFADPATAPGNATRAMAIPTLCKVNVDTSRCAALLAPASAPAASSPPSPSIAAPPVGAPTVSPTVPPPATPAAPSPVMTSGPTTSAAPSPTGANYDCTNAFNLLTPCLAFVSGNGTGGPPKDCCTSLGTVQGSEPVCLCQLLAQVANSSEYGVNATLAENLPKSCNVPADTSKCPALLGAPVSAPVAPVAAPTSYAPGPTLAPAVSTPVSSPSVSPASAPGPSGATVDCTNEFASLQTCFAYVSANDTTPPPANCCTSLQSVVISKPVCLCQLLQTVGSGDPAVQSINVTKATELPTACGTTGADVNQCPALLGQPVASPVANTPTSPESPASSAPTGGSTTAPSPAPARSGASTSMSTLLITFLTTLVGFAAIVIHM